MPHFPVKRQLRPSPASSFATVAAKLMDWRIMQYGATITAIAATTSIPTGGNFKKVFSAYSPKYAMATPATSEAAMF